MGHVYHTHMNSCIHNWFPSQLWICKALFVAKITKFLNDYLATFLAFRVYIWELEFGLIYGHWKS